MFCPKCGNECPDGAAFCNKCGAKIGDRVAGKAPTTAGPATNAATGTTTPPTPRVGGSVATSGTGTLPIIPIVAVLVVLLVGGGLFALLNRPAPPEPTPAASTAADSPVSMSEEAPERISPKENISVSGLKIEEDAVKRYKLTGTVSNSGPDAYDVDLAFSFIKATSDDYGDPQTQRINSISMDTVTPHTRANGATLRVYNLEPGKNVSFEVYPDFNDLENKLSNPEYEVRNASLPEAQVQWRFDYDKGIQIGDAKLASDGKLKIDFTNETGYYLKSTTARLVAYNSQGIPAVRSNSGSRPTGAVTKEFTVQTLKPHDQATFEGDMGEGYSKVDVMDITITPDPKKSQVN